MTLGTKILEFVPFLAEWQILFLPPTQTLDWNVALTATPGMLTIWHVLEAMSRGVFLCSENEFFYILSVSPKRQIM